MRRLGLTGGIASGKSAVGEMFVAQGAHLIQSDDIAHRLMDPGRPVYANVVRAFGWIVMLGRNGLVNQSLLTLGLVKAPLPLSTQVLTRLTRCCSEFSFAATISLGIKPAAPN